MFILWYFFNILFEYTSSAYYNSIVYFHGTYFERIFVSLQKRFTVLSSFLINLSINTNVIP